MVSVSAERGLAYCPGKNARLAAPAFPARAAESVTFASNTFRRLATIDDSHSLKLPHNHHPAERKGRLAGLSLGNLLLSG